MAGENCTWSTANEKWDEATYTWAEACFIVDVVGVQGGGYSGQLDKLKKRDKSQQKKFVKLLCRVKGEKYEQVKYFRPNIHVRISGFELLYKEVIKPNLHIFINKQN